MSLSAAYIVTPVCASLDPLGRSGRKRRRRRSRNPITSDMRVGVVWGDRRLLARTCRPTFSSRAPGTGHSNVPEIGMRRRRGGRVNFFR